MRSRLSTALVLSLVLGLGLAGAALAGNGGIAPPSADSPNASRITDSYWLIMVFTGFIFVLVEGALILFIVRFRRRGRPRDLEGPQIHGSTRLELMWTVVPVVILVLIGGFVFYKLPGIKDVPAASAGNRLHVDVEGRQFYWEFKYDNGAVAVDHLRAPVDQVVTLDVTAPPWDVIHSWWIPKLGGKFDAIPGRVNHTWFQAKKVGTYHGQCAELCGLQHAVMRATVEVMPRADFDAWLASRRTGGGDLGKETWDGVCAKCHNLSGSKLIGPNLGGNATLADSTALTQLVRNGRGQMPPVGRHWPDEQLNALLAYAKQEQKSGS